MAEQWFSIVEYARAFGISDMTIRRRIRTGRIQAVLRDGKYYIPANIDPVTGELRKQAAQPQPTVHKHPMKSHPHAEKTLPTQRNLHQPVPEPQMMQRDHAVVHTHIPTTHQRPQWNPPAPEMGMNMNMQTQHQQRVPGDSEVTVEARALLNYCNATLDTTRDRERLIEARHTAKMDMVSEQLKNRDMEIQKLQQQIEDLQLLVQILERKKS